MEVIGNFLRAHQLNIMLMLSGICVTIAIFTFFTNSLSKKRKKIMICLELSAACLLSSDRFAYIYRGDVSTMGYYMVRISNYLVFAMSLTVLFFFNEYLIDMYENEGNIKRIRRLLFCRYLYVAGMVMLIVSQFTGFYYYFDEMNRYVRGPGFIICYLIPVVIMAIEYTVIFQYRDCLSKGITVSIFLFTVIPIVATAIQLFAYGLSLTNLAIVGMVILLYLFAIIDLNERVSEAQKKEVEHLQFEQRKAQELLEETAQALASAIDAKDKYTNGHSNRVAEYSRMIAKEAGMSEEDCDEIYLAALLHDVGKIGIPDEIINKKGKLTPEEYEVIKSHPVIGSEILDNIKEAPYLIEGARHHHERYDGKGYPDKLSGNDIPEIARIISVADSYDAMTSNRSYRSYLSQDKVRNEIVEGLGSQFDPIYGQIMINCIDKDKDYKMHEH